MLNLQDEISRLVDDALRQVKAAATNEEIQQIRTIYLGRKGKLTSILRGVKDLPTEEKSAVGQSANTARQQLDKALAEAEERYLSKGKSLDISLPGIEPELGHLHLVTEGINDITRIFEEIGFTRRRHPEIESDWYAFEALNMPTDHPARDDWETFFIDHKTGKDERYLLTPHATSGTARSLTEEDLPIRVINIQKTYRRQIDASHVPMFHQFDGLYVGEGVTIQHLKGVFEYFVKAFFGPDREIRLRPFHFRFTEPSLELDITCAVCNGKGCKLCKQGWVELGGAGMLHPNVLKAAKLNPNKVTGLAFGWGVERTVLMRAGLEVPDLRMLYENDLRFLKQF